MGSLWRSPTLGACAGFVSEHQSCPWLSQTCSSFLVSNAKRKLCKCRSCSWGGRCEVQECGSGGPFQRGSGLGCAFSPVELPGWKGDVRLQ